MNIKAAVRERDGMKCTECGMTNEEHRKKYQRFRSQGASLHVHRIKPHGDYSLKNCVTLCFRCHGKQKRWINLMKRSGVDTAVISVEVPLDVAKALRQWIKEKHPRIGNLSYVPSAIVFAIKSLVHRRKRI